ncbi:hypothetical protein C8R45DRAFT_1131386 [Mycena sanguinolenta]|nr:hypothetical protein C8R45DRAFT_1131386 [Mycena sanguinolenta]
MPDESTVYGASPPSPSTSTSVSTSTSPAFVSHPTRHLVRSSFRLESRYGNTANTLRPTPCTATHDSLPLCFCLRRDNAHLRQKRMAPNVDRRAVVEYCHCVTTAAGVPQVGEESVSLDGMGWGRREEMPARRCEYERECKRMRDGERESEPASARQDSGSALKRLRIRVRGSGRRAPTGSASEDRTRASGAVVMCAAGAQMVGELEDGFSRAPCSSWLLVVDRTMPLHELVHYPLPRALIPLLRLHLQLGQLPRSHNPSVEGRIGEDRELVLAANVVHGGQSRSSSEELNDKLDKASVARGERHEERERAIKYWTHNFFYFSFSPLVFNYAIGVACVYFLPFAALLPIPWLLDASGSSPRRRLRAGFCSTAGLHPLHLEPAPAFFGVVASRATAERIAPSPALQHPRSPCDVLKRGESHRT